MELLRESCFSRFPRVSMSKLRKSTSQAPISWLASMSMSRTLTRRWCALKQARTRNSSCQAGYSESFTTYSTVQYSTVQYSTVQYSTVKYSKVQRVIHHLRLGNGQTNWEQLNFGIRICHIFADDSFKEGTEENTRQFINLRMILHVSITITCLCQANPWLPEPRPQGSRGGMAAWSRQDSCHQHQHQLSRIIKQQARCLVTR